MSWKLAQDKAGRIYTGLATEHKPGFIRMVIRALERHLNREERQKAGFQDAKIDPPFQDIKK